MVRKIKNILYLNLCWLKRGDKMKNKKIIIIIFFLIGIIFFLFYHFMWDTQSIPKGEMIKKVNFPGNKYCAYIYHGTGGATVDYSTIVEIKDNTTNTEKIIYFQYHQEYVDVKWIDDVRIKIGDRKLNILKDVYDSRH